MAVSSNISIKLNVHSPKKDAEFYTDGGHAPTGADEVTIWAAAGVEVGLPQHLWGTFMSLHAYIQSHLNQAAPSAGPTIVHGVLGCSDSEIEVDGIPTSDQCRIEIGANIVNKGQSHFLDRTFKRLIERGLEESK